MPSVFFRKSQSTSVLQWCVCFIKAKMNLFSCQRVLGDASKMWVDLFKSLEKNIIGFMLRSVNFRLRIS